MTQTLLPVPSISAFDAECSAQLTEVTKDFGRGVRGLDEVTLRFQRGTITALLGLSGSGKSTLLRHLNGLHTPSAGTVEVMGESLADLNETQLRQLRRRIGMIFQTFGLVGPMSVLENVCTGRLGSLRGPRMGLFMYPRAVRREALDHLDRVGLLERAHQRADTLSGGQQQRVAIARALMQNPSILLADEPVASLDPVSTAQVMGLLTDIARERDLTVITSLHQVELAVEFADRVVGLRAGAVVFDRDSAEMTADEAAEIYTAAGITASAKNAAAPAATVQVNTATPAALGASSELALPGTARS